MGSSTTNRLPGLPWTGSPPSAGGATEAPSYNELMGIYAITTPTMNPGDPPLFAQAVTMDADSDFLWTGISGETNIATQFRFFQINIRLPSGRMLANNFFPVVSFVGGSGVTAFAGTGLRNPTPVGPNIIYRAGSTRPLVDIVFNSQGVSAAKLTLMFWGVKRNRTQ